MKKGFTLIELLVVVLIIGILASVAMPQYEKAVRKARAVELWTAVDAFTKGQQLYVLTNGSLAPSLDALDIEVPAMKYFSAANGNNGSGSGSGSGTSTGAFVSAGSGGAASWYTYDKDGVQIQVHLNDAGSLRYVGCVAGSSSKEPCMSYMSSRCQGDVTGTSVLYCYR